ncbi:hypothetical protein [Pseudonocardia sp. ICBG601]|uniref:hypothetical protein n=1 Tax=Pseudonocardia sp. ICBG601 TaxID=2846759 RepID=UPI001CF6969D|nr:hypothetical protein [Pseudonocardia sp. ICBG601]
MTSPATAPTSSSRCSPPGATATRRSGPSPTPSPRSPPPGTRRPSAASSTSSSTSTATAVHHATELPAVKPTVEQFLTTPGAQTFVVPHHDPDYPVFSFTEILDAHAERPELEALTRWAMVLHNQYPWDRASTELRTAEEIGDDEYVIAFHPRNRDVEQFLDRATGARPARRGRLSTSPTRSSPSPRCPRSGCARRSRCSRRWRPSPSSGVSTSAPTTTSSATPRSPGHR